MFRSLKLDLFLQHIERYTQGNQEGSPRPEHVQYVEDFINQIQSSAMHIAPRNHRDVAERITDPASFVAGVGDGAPLLSAPPNGILNAQLWLSAFFTASLMVSCKLPLARSLEGMTVPAIFPPTTVT